MRGVVRTIRVRPRDHRRRGTVVPLVAVSMVTLVGFAALAIDVGMLYDARAELQRTADATAMAAAAELGASTEGDSMTNARAAAVDYATRNQVLNAPVGLDEATDIIFGFASIDSITNKYVFSPNTTFPNAVKVRTRRTAGSPSGPVPALFANLFGHQSSNVSAQAMAVLVPRDIVFVMDLSLSHNNDSSLRHYRLAEIKNRQVWTNLWDRDHYGPPPVEDTGPAFGNMTNWGTAVTDPNWNYATDAGMVYLPKNASWTAAQVPTAFLNANGSTNYNETHANTIRTNGKLGLETDVANYRKRVRIALGIDRWTPSGPTDTTIGTSEITQNVVAFPSSSLNPTTKSKKIGGDWNGFIDYVANTSGGYCHFLNYDPTNPDSTRRDYGNPNLRYWFGLKTLVEYPQESKPTAADSPGLAGVGEEPMGSVVTGVLESINIIESLEGSDQVGTAAYGDVGYGPADKSANLSYLTADLNGVRTKVNTLQAMMWTMSTNTADGIDKGADVLFDANHGARTNAAKVMILLTDGQANKRRTKSPKGSGAENNACGDAIQAAREAHARKVHVYCVSVGADSDEVTMETIARIGAGLTPEQQPVGADPLHFHASGSVDEYKEQLQTIFRNLGGRRPVVLAN